MITSAQERAARLAAGKTIIRKAGAIALDYFRCYRALNVQSKGLGELFSEADTSVESFIRGALAKHFPQDAQLGEEHGASAGDSVYRWVIDPIDGTTCFLYGLPTWCVVIALLEHGVPVVGLTYDACRDELFWASLGEGAYRNDSRIVVHTSAAIADGLTAIGGSSPLYSDRVGAIIQKVLALGGSYMRNGSTALSLVHVAAGHYVGYFQPQLNAWDCLAGLLTVSEAGGIANDFMSETGLAAQGDVFAAAPQVADDLAGIVGRK